jgi:vancomycin resistance protein VanJ
MTIAKRLFGRAAVWLIAAYGLILCLMLMLRVLGDSESTLIALINISITLLLMPALLLFPLCVVLRRWWLSTFLIVPFLTFMIAYLPFFLPRPLTILPNEPRLRLLTYNLHAEQVHVDEMVSLIRDANADIVTVQEMSPAADDVFDQQLADLYPYQALYPEPNGGAYHGRGLLSRYPISESKAWPVDYPIPVRLMRAVIDMNGTPITIYNFHAPPSYPIYGQGFDIHPRGQQIKDVLAMIAQESGAVLLMGDLNTNDADVNYPHIAAQLRDTFREMGWGMGFTGPDWSHPQSQEGLPFIPVHERMDYIFHNDSFFPVEAHVWPTSGGSDHRPLFAELALNIQFFYAPH